MQMSAEKKEPQYKRLASGLHEMAVRITSEYHILILSTREILVFQTSSKMVVI